MAYQNLNKWSVCQLLINLSIQERALELQRQLLAQMPDFEPYTAFCRLSKSKNVITKDDVWKFLLDNGRNCSYKHCKSFLVLYDNDNDGVISYKEFLDLILPKEHVQLRTTLSQKDCLSIKSSDTFSHNTEYLLCNLIFSDICLIQGLESEMKNFGNEVWTVTDIIMETLSSKKRGTGFLQANVNFNNLSDFIRKASMDMSEQEIINIIKRLDRDNDGVVSLQDLETVIRAILDPDHQPTVQERLDKVSKHSPNSKFNELDLSNEKVLTAYQRSKVRTQKNLDKSREKLGLEPIKPLDIDNRSDFDNSIDATYNRKVTPVAPKISHRDKKENPRVLKEYFKEEVVERSVSNPRSRYQLASPSRSQERNNFGHLVVQKNIHSGVRRESSKKPNLAQFDHDYEHEKVRNQPKKAVNHLKYDEPKPRYVIQNNNTSETQLSPPRGERERTPNKNQKNIVTTRGSIPQDYTRERQRRDPVVDKSIKEPSPAPTPTLKMMKVSEDTTSVDLFFGVITKMIERIKGIEASKRNLTSRSDFNVARLFDDISGNNREWISQKDLVNYLQKIGVKNISIPTLNVVYEMFDCSENALLTIDEFTRIVSPCNPESRGVNGRSALPIKPSGHSERRAKQIDGETEALLADVFSRILSLAKLVEETRTKCQKGSINLENTHRILSNHGKISIRLQSVA